MAVSAISFVLKGLMSVLICYVICSENSQWLTHLNFFELDPGLVI